jgi:hypothetical protein
MRDPPVDTGIDVAIQHRVQASHGKTAEGSIELRYTVHSLT